ncbi:signal peptidase I [Hyphobacterium sp.]|uniref:signal peptidase I n=1 Tax=Hyphobacterium sp. TaxID=2004662 RepID=UPI003748F2A8
MIRLVSALVVFSLVGVLAIFSCWAAYRLPSANMMPGIEAGDLVSVNKIAYGFSNQSLAFGIGRRWSGGMQFRLFARPPERGDVIIFWSEEIERSVVGRVIGLPEEVVELSAGRVVVDGAQVERTEAGTLTLTSSGRRPRDLVRYQEVYQDGTTVDILEENDESLLDDAGPFRVSEGFVFVLGDNRDNAIDSRVPSSRGGYGFVPVSHIIGRVAE